MRLAVISDIHGNQLALEAVLRDLNAASDYDHIWVLGDLVAWGARPVETLNLIRGLQHAAVIFGNTDRRLVRGERNSSRPKNAEHYDRWRESLRARDEIYNWTQSQLSYTDYEYLASLPGETDLHVPGYGWVIGYHGTPGHDEGLMWPDTPADVVLDHFLDREGRMGIGGHTHAPMDRDLGAWRVINPGSAGQAKGDRRASYAIITFAEGVAQVDFRLVAYDVQAAIDQWEQTGLQYWKWGAQDLFPPASAEPDSWTPLHPTDGKSTPAEAPAK